MRSRDEMGTIFFGNPKDQFQMLFNKTHVLTQCGPSYLDGSLEFEKKAKLCVCVKG